MISLDIYVLLINASCKELTEANFKKAAAQKPLLASEYKSKSHILI